jgi:very-short-patch-repair endonuclease
LEYKEVMGKKLYYIADFHNYQYKLIIEMDGKIHDFQKDFDDERENDIKFMGYKVLRFTNDEVLLNWEMVEKKILDFIASS